MEKVRYGIGILIARIISLLLRLSGRYASTLSGRVALWFYPDLLSIINDKCKTKIIITGTNGKTTTNNMVYRILASTGKNVLSNVQGANMITGIAGAFINNYQSEYDFGLFEVDEGSFPKIVKYIQPDYVVITNFFRDQLDRYGELTKTVSLIFDSLKNTEAVAIINADDPLVAQFTGPKTIAYGVRQSVFSRSDEKVVESRFCPKCNCELTYSYYNIGQSGGYYCPHCKFTNPEYDYSIDGLSYNSGFAFDFSSDKETIRKVSLRCGGLYNVYNACAAMSLCFELGIDKEKIVGVIESFASKLGRMEEIKYKNKMLNITLVKNPVGFTEVLKTITFDSKSKAFVFILNDNPADGRDVSWIWDVDFDVMKRIPNIKKIYCSGKRMYDIATRVKYSGFDEQKIVTVEDLKGSMSKILNEDVSNVYILPTYTALFPVRHIIKGHVKGRTG